MTDIIDYIHSDEAKTLFWSLDENIIGVIHDQFTTCVVQKIFSSPEWHHMYPDVSRKLADTQVVVCLTMNNYRSKFTMIRVFQQYFKQYVFTSIPFDENTEMWHHITNLIANFVDVVCVLIKKNRPNQKAKYKDLDKRHKARLCRQLTQRQHNREARMKTLDKFRNYNVLVTAEIFPEHLFTSDIINQLVHIFNDDNWKCYYDVLDDIDHLYDRLYKGQALDHLSQLAGLIILLRDIESVSDYMKVCCILCHHMKSNF